jgi:NAD(P)-dependent dehydrogenase (short-subunit alcohol dehydrogenase family)
VFELDGRVVVVTGGGGARVGTGAGIALAFAHQGATVAVNDKDPEAAARTVEGIEAAGGTAAVFPFDVREADAVNAGVERIRSELGPIEILVNSAGGGSQLPFREMEAGHWARIVELNLFGVVNCTRAVIGPMCDMGWGRIVTIASSSAFVGSTIGVSAYGAGKGGAVSFMRQLAIEVAPFGVTANCVAPGMVRLPGTRGDVGREVPISAYPPVGRIGLPEDIGALCVYLASPEASWMTGQTVHINGGAYTT